MIDVARHPNLAELAEKNTALMEKIGFNPYTDNPFELDNIDTMRQTELFPEEALQRIFSEETYTPKEAPKAEELSSAIGMVLIRPDMVQVAPQVESFLSREFKMLDISETVVTPETYWGMYDSAITNREMRQSRLTRAAVYIGSPCTLMVFERPKNAEREMPAADHVFVNLKGKQGVQEADTLRGEIVFEEAVRNGYHKLDTPSTALAVDPFGAYRKIIQSGVAGKHMTADEPLLFFTGVGIHAPNYREMQRDLKLLTDQEGEYEHAQAA